MWTGIADAIGTGLSPSPSAAAGTLPTPPPAPLGDDVAAQPDRRRARRVTSGPVVVRSFKSTPIISVDLNPRGVDAVVLDRADVARPRTRRAGGGVRAQPGVELPGLEQLRRRPVAAGVTRFAVAYTATKTLLADGDNVLSVDSSPGRPTPPPWWRWPTSSWSTRRRR